jgi:hypothetical protein
MLAKQSSVDDQYAASAGSMIYAFSSHLQLMGCEMPQ